MLSVTSPKFNAAQKAFITKYAAGLLLGWTHGAVMATITPEIGDGFEPPEGLFPVVDDEAIDAASDGENEPLQWSAHGEVCGLLDNWLTELATLAGFDNLDEALKAAGESNTVYGKYPVMKNEVHATV